MLKENVNDEELTKAIEELRIRQQQLCANYSRRHGKEGKECLTKWEEYKRLYNNVHSQESRLRKRELEKSRNKVYNEKKHNKISDNDEDEYGIRPVDERRYKKCFHSGYIGAPVYLKYIRRMTGLSLKQIAVLQKRTGLIPYPPVKMSEAKADEKRRWEDGDIY